MKGREICSEVITASTLIPACLGRDGGEEEEEPLPSGGMEEGQAGGQWRSKGPRSHCLGGNRHAGLAPASLGPSVEAGPQRLPTETASEWEVASRTGSC